MSRGERDVPGVRDVRLDLERGARLGLDEAVLCTGKSRDQLAAILDLAGGAGRPLLLTRLTEAAFAELPGNHRERLDYDPLSATACFGEPPPARGPARVAVVTAGTSDVPVGREAARTLRFHGRRALEVCDVGVAGLWRLTERLDELRGAAVVIAVAGMDAALPSVLGGLVPGLVIAVPTSTGYGMARGGETALHAALVSCAPGVVVVNIDNGYGAACAALRALGPVRRGGRASRSAAR
jgi:hypothetical protein